MSITKLTIVLLLAACLQLNAKSYGQTVTLKAKNISLEEAFSAIRKQTGYVFFYNHNLLEKANPVTVSIENKPVTDAVRACLQGQPFDFHIENKTVFITDKKQDASPHQLYLPQSPSDTLHGRITNEQGAPIPGTTIIVKGTQIAAISDDNGNFTLNNVPDNATLIITSIGYTPKEYTLNGSNNISISLVASVAHLDSLAVIVSTGYQQIPKERATGSFVFINNELLNRSVSTSIVERLNGMVSGLQYSEYNANSSYLQATNPIQRNTGLMIRGKSTINAFVNSNPLIVVDNFPYDGDLSNINPNDVQSITVLKDAAASSIWGARAGNGVVVITTKKGRKDQPLSVEFNTNLTVQNKPDIYYDKNYLNSTDFIEVEKYLFDQGYYNSDLSNTSGYPSVTPAVDIFAAEKAGTISTQDANRQLDSLRNIDVRGQWGKYFYQKAVKQQYYLGLHSGTDKMTNSFSVGFDKNIDNYVRNGFDRLTINSFNTYTPIKNLSFTAGINYVQSTDQNDNNVGYRQITIGGSNSYLYPYAQFADANGNSLAIVKDYRMAYADAAESNGFLDWHYRPIDELRLADNKIHNKDFLLKVSAKYNLTSYLNLELMYQNETQKISTRNYQSPETFYVRDLINKFTEINSDGSKTYNFPNGGILDMGETNWYTNNARAQLSFDKTFKQKHTVTAILGSEIKQLKTEGYSENFYGYDPQFATSNNTLDYTTYYQTNPEGSSRLPSPSNDVSGILNRYVSFYGNAAYNYDNRYTVTISGRKDGTNLFGIKTNDKITPLWSAGLGWTLSNEKYYHSNILPYLKMRISYGENGNIYNGSAYSTGIYLNDVLTGAPAIYSITAPDPELHWEKIKTANFGVDFAFIKNIFSGTVEYYIKKGSDLIEPIDLTPSSGFTSFNGNAAGVSNKGLDINLTSHNIDRLFKWNTTLIFSTLSNKITKYDPPLDMYAIQGGYNAVGYPLYGIFSYKWAGLDPLTGDPQGYLNGEISKDYAGIMGNYQPDSLVYNGSSSPTVFGSLRNDFSFKGFSLSFSIFYELGYVFRRSSITGNYQDMIGYYGNADYDKRWQQPGDEKLTNVPSLVYPSDANRKLFYQYSDALVSSGSNIRLHDIRLAYNFSHLNRTKFIKKLQVYAYASQIGILWRANKYGIDPDVLSSFGAHDLPSPFSLAFGLNVTF